MYTTATGIKEVVRIGAYTPDAVYRYTLRMDGLTPVQKGQEIALYMDNVQVGRIQAPYMTDEAGAYSSDISVSLYGKGDGVFELVYVPDDGWLASESRAYPIKLDPTIEFTGSTTLHMEDNYVSRGEPSRNFTYNATEVLAGGVNTAYIRPVYVDALSTTSPVLIKSAALNLYCKKGSGTLRLHQVQGTWNSRTITYNSAPSYGNTISTKSVSQGKVTWDITEPFSSWFHSLDQAGSFGVALEGTGPVTFSSADTPNNRMTYSVTYYLLDEANTLTASTQKDQDDAGYVDLSWAAIPHASGYYVGIYNGRAYEYVYVGNITSWSTKGKGLWPTPAEIANGRYQLHLDGTGTDLPLSPAKTYQNAGTTSLAYSFDVRPANAYKQAANTDFKRSVIFPEALGPEQPTSVQVSPSTWTNAQTIQVSWSGVIDHLADGTVLTMLEEGGRIQFSVDGITNWLDTGSRESSGTYALNVSTLADGTHTVYIRGLDKDGNAGAPLGAAFLLDKTAPTAPQLSLNPAEWTIDREVIVTWSDIIEQASGIDVVAYRIDDGEWTETAKTEASGSIALQAETLSEGTHSIEMRATDKAGNVGEAGTAQIGRDVTPPTLETLTVIPSVWSDADEVEFSWTGLMDTGSGLQSYTYTLNAEEPIALAISEPEGTEVLDVHTLPDGQHTAVFRYIDTAGNAAEQTVYVYRDTTLPEARILQPADGDFVNGIVNVTGTAKDAMAMDAWELMATGENGNTVTVASGSENRDTALLGVLDTGVFADGEEVTLTLQVKDRAGHTQMATGVVIKVDKSMKDLAGEITLLAPTQGEILIDPVYGGQYENGSENGWVYVDGTKTAEADGRTFAFPAIRYEEDSSHTISVISVDTDEQLSYSKGLALLVIGSNAEGTDTSYTSDELVAPKNILALRLTSSESEAGSIEYGYSCDNKETWNQIEPDRDVRLDGSAKSVWLKAEPKDGAVLYGWALSAVIEKEPVLSTVQLKREVEPFSIIEEEVLTEAPDQNIETDAPTELAFKRLYANGILVNEEDFTYETLRTEEQRQVKLAALGLTESGIVYASGNAQSKVLLRQIVSSDGLFVQTEALQKPEEEEEISDSIYAIRLLAETASEGCTFYVSIDETNWIGIEPDTYLFLPDASDTVYCRAEQTELGQLMAWHIEGVSAGERRFTVQLMRPPRGVVAKDYGKHANRRVELSWSAPDNADADTTYVVYKNSTVYAIVTTTSFTDSAYTENASYAVSAKKTFEKPGEVSYMRYLQRESEQAQASRVVIQPPAQTPVHNELIDFADEQTRRALYGGTYLFTNDMLEPPAGPTLNQKLLGRNKYCSLGFEPVNFNTGNFFLEATDYTQADIGQTLSIQRTYNTQSTMEDGPFGEKWTFPYGQYLEMYTSGAIGYRNASGALTVFTPNGAGGFTGNDEDHLVFTEDRVRGEYTVRKKDGTRTVFEKNSGWLIRIEDRNGNAIQLHRKKIGFMDAIEMASGAKLLVTTDERGHVTQIHLPDGSDLRYTYEGKRLTSFTDQNGYITRYEYDEKGRMTAWRDGLGVYQVQNTYDEKDRVTFQKDGLNGDYKLEYHDDNTIVTDAMGNTSEIWFDSLHRTIREVNALDSTIEYFYDEANNLVGTTDADGKLLSSVYDERGNQLKNILPDGSMGTKTYDKDDNLLSYTDANGNTISYTYDAHGNLLTATDALENVTSYAYNERGQVTSVKDALGGMTVYRYQGANVVQVTSANRSVTAYAYDTAGRLVRTTDPMGNVISYAYDACGNVLSVRLPNGAQTRYAYDAVRNCVLMTDALGNETRYKYDALRHLTAILYADGTRESTAYDLGGNAVEQIDALGNATKMAYDPVGNLIAVTDAEGNRTEYAYDKQNRLVCETLPTGATRTYTYDPNSGLVTKTKDERGSTTELTYDAVGNVLTSTRKNGAKQTTEYDALNRVIRQTDANGGVTSYKYDALGRATEETNALGGVTAYAYDPVGNLIEVTDALGNTTRAKYDPRNQLLSVTDPLGATTAYTYDAVGNLTSVTDPLRNRTTYRYDLAGNLIDMIDALGLRQSYAYDSRGRVVTTKQKDGGTTAIAYDAVGNVVQLTDALGSVTRFAYNPFGQTTEVTDALGQKAKMLYDALGNMTRVTSPDGSFTLYTYDPAGQLLSAVDPAGDRKAFVYDEEGNLIHTSENGNETSYRYDPAGNILGMTDAEGRAAGFLYDAMGNLTKTIYPDGTEAINEYDVLGRIVRTTPRHGVERAYAYDAAGQVTEVHEGERVTKYAYDLSGNLIRVTAPDGSVTTYRYDALNRPVRVIDALGNETTYGYDAMDRLVSARQPNGATIRLAYDPVGNLLSETDALGAKQTFAYDALGRLQEVTDALGHRTAYGYDALDNLTLVRDANGNETRYKYDSLSRLRSETDALGNTTQYEYTPEGWLKETKRPDGTTLSYDYDRTGRLLKESASDGTEIRHDFDAMGQLTEIEDENGTTKLRYDERGLLIGVENPLGDVVQYEYNQYAEKTCLIYPDGKRAEYAYDSMSRLLSVTEPNGTTTAYTYDALGRRTRTSDSTLTTEYGYDAVGNLVRQVNENVTLTYRYDLNNRMTEEARTEGGTTLRSGFAYDKAGQLTSFRRSDGYAEAYTYDPVGNMVEKVLNGTKIAMTYDAANELKTMESPHGKLTYIYDLNGNLTRKTLGDRTDTYSYDARNRLKQYRGYDNYQVKYSYNALGMLHARESSGNHSRTTLEELIAGKEDSDDPDGNDGSHITTYTYDLTQPYYQVLTETTDGATTAYTYGLERLAAYTENTRTAYLYDGRGSVIQTRGSLGTQTMAYSAYGELLTEKTSGYGYNGEYYDAATGMLNLRARQYEPAQARFCQYDPLRGSVFAPQSLNRYLYCWNDPVDIIDPSGKLGILGILAIGALVGGVIGGAASIIEQKSQGQKINWGEVGRSAVGGATAGLAITAGGLTGGIAGAAAVSTVELIAGTRTALTGGSVADVLQSAGTGGGAAAISAAVAPAVPATAKVVLGTGGAVGSAAKLYKDLKTAKQTFSDPLSNRNDRTVAVLDVATDGLALAGSILSVTQNLKPSVSELKQASTRARQTTNTSKQTFDPQRPPSASTQAGEQAAGCSGGESWYKSDGSINYPPNNGAVPGTEVEISLKPGDVFRRYGEIRANSVFVTEAGADAGKLSLPPNTDPSIYQEFIVVHEIPETMQSEIRAWAGSPGGGVQYELPAPILQLLKEGYIIFK